MNLELEFRLRAERTPNPQSIKWVVHPPLQAEGRSAYFRQAPRVEVSPLAAALFSVDGILEVLLAAEFVTVTKAAEAAWPDLAEPVFAEIKAFATQGEPVFGPEAGVLDTPADGNAEEDRTTAKIRAFLDKEIRPLVARDGGELLFVEFREGVVHLALQGACSGCPNSTQTLKFGIEERLKAAVPEVREVVAL